MSIGKNIQFLRKQQKITQEQLAERMAVSRQTVSKWETDEVTPELGKLIDLSDFFRCKLDVLVREELSAYEAIYSEITIKTVKPFRMGRYVMITPNPEDDVNAYLDVWAEKSGLLACKPDARKIGWDFPHVSLEQQNRFGLRGYAAAFERIPNGYKRIMEYLSVNGFKEKPVENVLSCFEYVHEQNGMTCMDVYIHVNSVSKTEAFTNFS